MTSGHTSGHQQRHWPDWPPPSSASGQQQIGDLRERMARLETAAGYAADRLRAHSDRIRLAHERIGALEQTASGTCREMREVPAMRVRLERLEARARAAKEWGQYALAAVLIGLTLSGHVTVEQLVGIALRLGLGVAPVPGS